MVTASRDSVFGELSGGEAGGLRSAVWLDLSRRDGLLLAVHTKLRSFAGNSLKDAIKFYQV